MDGDVIVEVQQIDEGWMYGRVERTGQQGMLPANYVEAIWVGGAEKEGKRERKSPVPSHLNAAFSWFYSCSLTFPVRSCPILLSHLLQPCSALTVLLHHRSPLSWSVSLSVPCLDVCRPLYVSSALAPFSCCHKWKALEVKVMAHRSMSGVSPCRTAPS